MSLLTANAHSFKTNPSTLAVFFSLSQHRDVNVRHIARMRIGSNYIFVSERAPLELTGWVFSFHYCIVCCRVSMTRQHHRNDADLDCVWISVRSFYVTITCILFSCGLMASFFFRLCIGSNYLLGSERDH